MQFLWYLSLYSLSSCPFLQCQHLIDYFLFSIERLVLAFCCCRHRSYSVFGSHHQSAVVLKLRKNGCWIPPNKIIAVVVATACLSSHPKIAIIAVVVAYVHVGVMYLYHHLAYPKTSIIANVVVAIITDDVSVVLMAVAAVCTTWCCSCGCFCTCCRTISLPPLLFCCHCANKQYPWRWQTNTSQDATLILAVHVPQIDAMCVRIFIIKRKNMKNNHTLKLLLWLAVEQTKKGK